MASIFKDVKHEFAATTAPGTGDDSADGFSVGSYWYDTTADKAYVCLDNTATAAVWTEITQAGGASGAWTLISSQAASSSATIDFTSIGTYKAHLLMVANATPATDGAQLLLRMSRSGTFDAGASDYTNSNSGASVLGVGANAGSTTGILFGQSGAVLSGTSNAANRGQTSICYIGDATAAAPYTFTTTLTTKVDTAGRMGIEITGSVHNFQAAVDGFRCLFSSGNVSTGRFILLGAN